MRTLVINRDKDLRRLDFVSAQVAEHDQLTFHRVAAVDAFDPDFRVSDHVPPGSLLTAPIPEILKWRGALGCLLSHAKCWHLAATGHDEAVLVLEDDAELTGHLPTLLVDLGELAQFDLIFINNRMVAYRKLLDDLTYRGRFLSIDAFHGAMGREYPAHAFDLAARNPHGVLKHAPGTDGYVLSRSAASRLLANLERFGLAFTVDWMLYVSGTQEATVREAEGAPARARTYSSQMLGRDVLINTLIYDKPVVCHAARQVGGSVLRKTAIGA